MNNLNEQTLRIIRSYQSIFETPLKVRKKIALFFQNLLKVDRILFLLKTTFTKERFGFLKFPELIL
jgi:hypothetical protein